MYTVGDVEACIQRREKGQGPSRLRSSLTFYDLYEPVTDAETQCASARRQDEGERRKKGFLR
jgi:hypothetical protein